jgi:hypothetical protein
MRRGRRRECNRCNIPSETRSRRDSALRAGWVAMIQGPACVKERESKIATIQNQCRRLRGVESLELQKVVGRVPFIKKITPRAPTKPNTRKPARMS